jgi:ABC-type polysaccharide/polyol phosphate transport system ATPase subunit
MNDVVIRARDLKKVYRLYSGAVYRFLDIFGMLRTNNGAYTEHAALAGINLEIRRGEKVAFIGRNGAGKSTLLKLLTGVIEPTSGTLKVEGKAHALLQIGSGFHPDFTGRENVYAYLAQLGVTGREADRQYAEIVEFAELEEYIGQPVKTYSSGMAVRLMFATSTAITPDLLVLDEVLGVGDAYFAHKSYGRIREMCDRDGTTLLLVTHDVYSAVSICERVIWIDRGAVLMDGDGATVVNAYENSIRLQEEQRLRIKAEQRSRELAASERPTPAVVEIFAADANPLPCPVYFSRIELFDGSTSVGFVLKNGVAGEHASLQQEATSWGDAGQRDGRLARPLLNFGSSYHKVAGTLAAPASLATANRESLSVEVDYWAEAECAPSIRVFVDGREISLGQLPPSPGRWATHRAMPTEAGAGDRARTLTSSGRQGTGAIVVDKVTPVSADGVETFSFRHGEPFTLRMHYRIQQPGLLERAQVLVAFHRDGIHDVMRTIWRDHLFDETQQSAGVINLRLGRLPLANGTYSVTVMVARENYYDEPQSIYFSINPGVYTCLTRVFDMTVGHGGIVGSGTGVVADAEWSVQP